jgi:hypothetical protein
VARWKEFTRPAAAPLCALLIAAAMTDPGERRWLYWLLGAILLWGVFLALPRVAASARFAAAGRGLAGKPLACIGAAAVIAGAMSAYPVLFSGASYMSPGNGGVLLVYETAPTLPGPPIRIENVRGADVGAMLWQHFSYAVMEERALKEQRELPLWNRFNGAGRSLIGQGLSMIGDPVNLAIVVSGVSALAFDLKFVALKMLFVFAIGASVYLVSASLRAAMLITGFSAFLTYFIFRINHPAIFSVCYAPLAMLAWIGLGVHGACQPRRWLVLLVAANWLLVNSGTAKEAYVMLGLINAMGAVFAWLAAGGSRVALLGIAAAVLSLLIAAPAVGTLADSISAAFTPYQEPRAEFMAPSRIAGFVDNLFVRLGQDEYIAALNVAVAFGVGAAGFALSQRPGVLQTLEKRLLLPLFSGIALCVALSIGVVGESVILATPILRNIHHLPITFLTAALVPCCVAAGVGFAAWQRLDNATRKRQGQLLAAVLVALVLVGVLGGSRHSRAVWATAYLLAGLWAVWIVARGPLVADSWLRDSCGVASVSLALLVLLGRGAAWGEGKFDSIVFNPSKRVDLLAVPAGVSELASGNPEPARSVSIGGVLFSGYRTALGFESIDGPDPFETRTYRELMEALAMPYGWSWRMEFEERHLGTHRRALDFLGVGLVFSGRPLAPVTSLESLRSEDRLHAYKRARPWPRAFYSDSVISYQSAGELAKRIESSAGPFVALPEGELLANEALRRLLRGPGSEPRIVPASGYRLTTNITSFRVEAPAGGVVYIGEAGEPGDFRVKVNGVSAECVRANHAFKAIVLPAAGDYEISIEYWPRMLTRYLALAAAGLVALLVLLWRASPAGLTLRARPV